jgi:light-regulated signal transduction histidine kinase (bacteriophytochrome)
MSDLAEQVLADLKKNDRKREVTVSISPKLTVDADPNLLRIVLENLLGNAWKFTEKRSQAAIQLGVTTRNGLAAYFVRDNGAGFDMAYASKLFRPFQRLHAASEFAGTGIGLATVQRIIQRHGGRVWAESEVEKGATFYFILP